MMGRLGVRVTQLGARAETGKVLSESATPDGRGRHGVLCKLNVLELEGTSPTRVLVPTTSQTRRDFVSPPGQAAAESSADAMPESLALPVSDTKVESNKQHGVFKFHTHWHHSG